MAQPLQSSAPVTTGAEYPSDEGIERRRHPRYRMDAPSDEPIQVSPQVDRRQRERRTVDDMRVELQRAYMQPGNAGNPPRNRWFGPTGLKPMRLVLLLVALTAGGLAAYLASRSQPAAEPRIEAVTEVIKEPRQRVLVAKTAIGIGQNLLPDSIGWEEWPEGSVLPDYITAAAAPDAVDTMSDAVARFEFFPGDPIREQKLVREAQGYLSAVLEPGKRGVSVSVSAVAASGGFISPNDHVDVLLTRRSPGIEASETILHNVRVLAINARLGETGATGAPENPEDPQAARFLEALATLELDATQAQVIVGAAALGNLTLVLRAMSDFDAAETPGADTANQAIRLTSPFWTTAGSIGPQ